MTVVCRSLRAILVTLRLLTATWLDLMLRNCSSRPISADPFVFDWFISLTCLLGVTLSASWLRIVSGWLVVLVLQWNAMLRNCIVFVAIVRGVVLDWLIITCGSDRSLTLLCIALTPLNRVVNLYTT